MKRQRVYLAGPLFGIADRHHNLLLARDLERLGYTVVLPQIEAASLYEGDRLDLVRVAQACRTRALNTDCLVANVDGTDADSGTALEIGVALSRALLSNQTSPIVICVRTDMRTDPANEVGVNAMLQLAHRIIYKPADANSLSEVARFYRELAEEIHSSIEELKDDN